MMSLKSMSNFRPYLQTKKVESDHLNDYNVKTRPKGGPLILTSTDRHLQAKLIPQIKDTGQFLRTRVIFSAHSHRLQMRKQSASQKESGRGTA
jgi:hypothetical protein